jgi:hypothetical protein
LCGVDPLSGCDFSHRRDWVCYTLVSVSVIHYTPVITILHRSMPIPGMRYLQPSAGCSAGKFLDSQKLPADSTVQHPENRD